ncbi:MAG: MerR family transcriptional regulator [Proteobacteria bacterium]|nr:MerR family transcriptional regulator [Pseudomonadota bacterium]
MLGRRTYRIGKAAEMLGLNTSVLRYWESEFPQIRPIRTIKGQRLYTDDHLAFLERLRDLLHKEGLTIEGARKRLEQELRGESESAPCEGGLEPSLKREVRDELLELRRLLSDKE